MNRRVFIGISGLVIASVSIFPLLKQKKQINKSLTRLSLNLQPYYNEEYDDVINDKTPEDQLKILFKQSVIRSDSSVDPERLKDLAAKDKIVVFNNKYYSEIELILYNFSYGLLSGEFDIDDSVISSLGIKARMKALKVQ